jgi:hypothetical protein
VVAALVAAPFVIHNKPLGAVIGFLALFGFWEVWEGFAKQPFLDVYKIEQTVCSTEEDLIGGKSHTIACRAEALRVTVDFFWQHAVLAVLKEGPTKAFTDFDAAFEKEQILANEEDGRAGEQIIGHIKQRPLEGHRLQHEKNSPTKASAEQHSWLSRIQAWFRGGQDARPNQTAAALPPAAPNPDALRVASKSVPAIAPSLVAEKRANVPVAPSTSSAAQPPVPSAEDASSFSPLAAPIPGSLYVVQAGELAVYSSAAFNDAPKREVAKNASGFQPDTPLPVGTELSIRLGLGPNNQPDEGGKPAGALLNGHPAYLFQIPHDRHKWYLVLKSEFDNHLKLKDMIP